MPRSLRLTLRDALDCAISAFRIPPYYDQVAESVVALIRENGHDEVVELGAGSAPLTRRLAARRDLPTTTRLIVTDLAPDPVAYQELEAAYPQRIHGCRSAVDFLRPIPFDKNALLVFSACFHHIPRGLRKQVLQNVRGHRVLVAEPICNNWWSLSGSVLLCIPILTTPLWAVRHHASGHLRRVLWCWLLPLAIPFLIWDGVVSCLRCWTDQEWETELLSVLPEGRRFRLESSRASTFVSW